MAIETATGSAGARWCINDEVTQLREWASTTIHRLPALPAVGDKLTIGASDNCWLRLQDPQLLVSRQHARLTYEHPAGWTITDTQSKNGLIIDGVPRLSFPLTPGAEILIGGVTLVAESPRLSALRDVLARLIGWSAERQLAVDIALRAVRMAIFDREPLLLCANAGYRSIARLLHRYVIGAERPFIVYERRNSADKTERKSRAQSTAPAHATIAYECGPEALAAATGGTLMVPRKRLPDDFDHVLALVHLPTTRVFLIVCSQTPPHGRSRQLIVPPLTGRSLEIDRIIDEYAADAVTELGLGGSLTPAQRNWVAQENSTLAGIESATRRLIVLRAEGGNVNRAARRLELSPGSLSPWVARRDLPGLRDEVADNGDDDDSDE